MFPRCACELDNSEFLKCMLSGGTWVQVTTLDESRNTSRGRLDFSKRNTKVLGQLLSTKRRMSAGTLSKTHQRQALKG